MGKIIIVTFAFMAFALYQMSGGGAFVSIADEKRAALAEQGSTAPQPAAKQTADVADTTEADTPVVAQAAVTDTASTPAPLVVLASASAAESATQAVIKPSDENALSSVIAAAIEEAKSEDLTTDATALASPLVGAEPQDADIREVTSARVNMRNGPGRDFDVVAKLRAGDRVEILQDPGDGWVKLQVEDTGRVGWMADFLLTAANN